MRRLWNRLFGKDKRNCGAAFRTSKLFKFLVTTPISLFIAFTIAFFCFDDFNTYVVMLFTRTNNQPGTSTNYGAPSDWSSYPGGGGGALVPGEIGARAMYVNQMNGGYYKEYLEIVRDHVNGKYMQEAVTWMHDENGNTIYPSIALFLGFCIKETVSPDGIAPYSLLSMDRYKKSPEMTLYQWNSAAIAKNDVNCLPANIGKDLLWNNYYTQLQHQKGYAAIYPTGDTGIESHYYPSLLNGYGIPENSVRTKRQHDAAYLPDQVSMVVQFINKSITELDASAKPGTYAIIAYPYWNGGLGMLKNSWAVGGRSGSDIDWTPANNKFSGETSRWHANNTVAIKSCRSEAANTLYDLYQIAEQKIDGIASDTKFNYLNHSDYNGLVATALLLNGGFIGSERSLNSVHANADSAGFLRGAWTAYRIYKDDGATKEQVQTWLRSMQMESIDTAFYGPVCLGKEYKGGGNDEIVVHMYGDLQVYNEDGQGPRKVLHAYPIEGTSGAFMSQLAGIYSYWKMLLASGVECTLGDAYRDTLGAAVGQQSGSPMGQINNSSIARAGVSFAYATQREGWGNDGTPLYRSVHRAILGSDPYFQSCDRCVCCAVRWAGADDTYPPGGCSVQLPYLISSPKWQEVKDWAGKPENLQPGDVLIRSDLYELGLSNGVGHTVLFTGNALIREKYPSASESMVIVSASYNQRSPGCQGWYSDLAKGFHTYRVFRNVQKEENSRYVNISVSG